MTIDTINEKSDRLRRLRLRAGRMSASERNEIAVLDSELQRLWYHRRRCDGNFCCSSGYLAGALPKVRFARLSPDDRTKKVVRGDR